MRTHLLAAALAASCASASALDIKGIEVGGGPDNCKVIEAISDFDAGANCRAGVPSFAVRTTFLGAKQSLMVLLNEELRVSTVFLNGFDFEQAEVAFTAKFGKPKAVNSVIQNGLGATFQQRQLLWENATSVLRMDRHGNRIGTSTASLDNKKDLAKLLKLHEAKAGDI